MRRFGLLSLLVVTLGACGVRYGFSQGGFPRHIRTVAVQPLENETASAELPRELLEELRNELRSRFGLRDAAPDRADALVRGVIRTYDIDVPVAFSADRAQSSTALRRLQVTMDVEIVDQSTGKALFERKGMRAEGEYPERGEAAGRRQAVERLVRDIVEGAQSQW